MTTTTARQPVTVDGDELFTQEEVSEMFCVTTRAVRRWTADGLLPKLALAHRTVRYRSSDVKMFRLRWCLGLSDEQIDELRRGVDEFERKFGDGA